MKKRRLTRTEVQIAGHFAEILALLGLDGKDPHLRETPNRVALMYSEIFRGVKAKDPQVTVFPNREGYDSMLVVRDIPFYSVCSHHLIPFFGVGHIGYLPDKSIVGLSKLARILEHYALRPQVQERLTEDTANYLMRVLKPRGVMVVLEARHLCMEMRGVEKPGSLTVTSTVRGRFKDHLETREEFLRHLMRVGAVPR